MCGISSTNIPNQIDFTSFYRTFSQIQCVFYDGLSTIVFRKQRLLSDEFNVRSDMIQMDITRLQSLFGRPSLKGHTFKGITSWSLSDTMHVLACHFMSLSCRCKSSSALV